MRVAQEERGFTYLGLLIAIALIGLGLSIASELWSKTAERQRLAELEWVGQQYVQAIGSYYEATPGVVVKTYPPTLEHLVADPRYVAVRRHIRQLYPNPMGSDGAWELVNSPRAGVRGVRATVQVAGQMHGPITKEFSYAPLDSR